MKLNSIDFQYKNSTSKVLDNVILELEDTMVNVLIGMNGAGKTTMLDIISGAMLVPNFIPPYSIKQIAYQPQMVRYSSSLYGKDIINAITSTTVEYNQTTQDRLNELGSKKLGVLSSGEIRWLTIAIVSKLNKKLFIFDEPTSGVDPYNKKSILSMLEELTHEDKIVLTTIHDLNDLNGIPCKIHFLYKGRIAFSGYYEEFLKLTEGDDPNNIFVEYIEGIKS